jgi:hypothetical protein
MCYPNAYLEGLSITVKSLSQDDLGPSVNSTRIHAEHRPIALWLYQPAGWMTMMLLLLLLMMMEELFFK